MRRITIVVDENMERQIEELRQKYMEILPIKFNLSETIKTAIIEACIEYGVKVIHKI